MENDTTEMNKRVNPLLILKKSLASYDERNHQHYE